ncbi:MAG: S1 RNA-binding domain-containing protein [Muribaculaceae bacterium]|nr:S1 RNA-binding domain-containing protein [Muribaculaceae bacterium]
MIKIPLHIGDIVKGKLKTLTKNYALIELGELIATLPSSEFSWHKDCNLKNLLRVGDLITAAVIIIDSNNVVISVKRLIKNPWTDIESNYIIGQKVKGKVDKIVSFGAFIKLKDGLVGLLHKSEMSVDGKSDPSAVLSINQEIEAEITSIESDKKRISFSTKYRL